MKTSTKILLLLELVFLVASIFLGRFVFATISATDGVVSFVPTPLGWVGLACQIVALVLSAILFFKFVRSQRLANAIFFSAVPLTMIYGGFVCGVVSVQNLQGETANALRNSLQLSQQQTTTKLYLWIGLATLIYLVLLFLVIKVSCRPLVRVARITKKLGDGRTKLEDFRVGGVKQFREIENSLNKINYNINSKENRTKQTNLQGQKTVARQLGKVLGKANVVELELGKKVRKNLTVMFCDLKNSSQKTLSLEENFNYINSYLKIVSPLVKRYDGFVDKHLGDGILAVFAKPEQAVECAHAILRAIEVKNKNQKDLPSIDAGLSLNCGEVVFGLVGEQDRKIATIVSDVSTLSTKMQEVNTYLGTKLLISKTVLNNLPAKYDFNHRYVGDLTLEDEQLPLYESLDCCLKSQKDKLKRHKNKFEAGVRAYNSKNYTVAKENFEYILHYLPEDKPSFVYFNRANEKLKEVT